MPRRTLLNQTERDSLLALPDSAAEWIRYYTLNDADHAVIAQHRGDHNRLGFALQLCYLRYPGVALQPGESPDPDLLLFVANQLDMDASLWEKYAIRGQTRNDHQVELQSWLGLEKYTAAHAHQVSDYLITLAQRTDRGITLASAMLEKLRRQHVILPSPDVIDRICSEALTQGARAVYNSLTGTLENKHLVSMDCLLGDPEDSKVSPLNWLRFPPGATNVKHILIHIERLKTINNLALPDGLERTVHQNWLRKLASEGRQMTAQHLRDLEPRRRYATVLAVVLDTRSTLIDQIIELNGRILGKAFSKAKRSLLEKIESSGRSINHKLKLYTQIGNVLIEAKKKGEDPFPAIEKILPWDEFLESVEQAQDLTQTESFDHLPLVANSYSHLRRYIPALLEILDLKAAPPAQPLLEAIELLKDLNKGQNRRIPGSAPTSFIRARWSNLVLTPGGIDRRFYELCVLSELRNSLRSGDIWVKNSRQFKDFEEYLVPRPSFVSQLETKELGLAVDLDCERFLESRLELLDQQLSSVEQLAALKDLPDTEITAKAGLKISPLKSAVPKEANVLASQVRALVPRLKITELLLEVDHWTNFTRHFSHLKSGESAAEKVSLLTAILSDGINLGLTKMSESCPGTTYSKLSSLHAWHVRDETYSLALAELTNALHRHPFASWWGDGSTSSSDGQNFKSGGRGRFAGQVNLKYGNEPGVQFYTHISDQYSPFHTKVVSTTVRDATHVLDGLLYHQSELKIQEHYTDTAGFTDHVFGLMQLLGYRFAPRIRGLADKRLYIHGDARRFPTLTKIIGGKLNVKLVRAHWNEILRLVTSIKQGSVTASLMLRKLGSYPRQNKLAVALRELGRIERTLFTLDWLQNVELRRRVQVGLNKGEAKNALARAVFFNRLGEMRDQRFSSQRHHASGLNLVVAAIILWNTVYLDRAVTFLQKNQEIDQNLLTHLSPLGWSHINLTGDYAWNRDALPKGGGYRPLRGVKNP